ncbi:hypothetical protein PABG_06975 [Paracoccidioides brasiliensis Pb03]|nr:hypothetical protein PABG_06975 [Paracoccidioides brasiliensis Pb03]
MPTSDPEYVAQPSDNDLDELIASASDDDDELDTRPSASGRAARSKDARRRKKGRGGAEWEVSRTWETLVEGADGTIRATVEGLLEAGKRRRVLRDTTPLQRGIIRHLILILDLSSAMSEKDLRPTRYLLTLRYAQDFVREFFDQNPISQLGVVGMRDGLAVRISDMSGNPTEHILAIQGLRAKDPKGMPSLQNALEMARGALFHTPSHGTREVLIIYGALLSSDPGDIHKTITSLITDKIHVYVLGLAAQVSICQELVTRTNNGDDSGYNVAMNEQHFRELVLNVTTPPATTLASHTAAAAANGTGTNPSTDGTLLPMGFPNRHLTPHPTLCACHSTPSRSGYLCPRCCTKVCTLPASCPSCNLTLILSTHLARSYHHLFPLMNWVEVSWRKAARAEAEGRVGCFACGVGFAGVPGEFVGAEGDEDREEEEDGKGEGKGASRGISVSGRYECLVCRCHFCIDCDVFAHEVVHNCPGCQSGVVQVREQEALDLGGDANGGGNGNGNGNGNGAVDVMDTE